MSYPYTKPVPRYGFRRRWGDPHRGLVGSGPGRPMRRYATDPEVGLPQLGPGLTSLGASPETPFNEGIFTMGPEQGFSRGVFTPDPPWATPRYIASTPDGVSGFGAFGADPKCGIPELVDKVIAQFPKLKFSLSGFAKTSAAALGLPTSFSIGPSPEIIEPIVYGLVGQAGENLGALADKGSGYIAGQLASRVSGPITQKILATQVPDNLKGAAAGIIGKLVDDTLRKQLYRVGEIIRDCAGVEKPAAAGAPGPGCYCQPDGSVCQDDTWCYSRACQGGKCVNPVAKLKFLIAKKIVPPPPVKLVGMSDRALQKFAAKHLTTVQAAMNKCWDSGGEWYPGGAMCDINPVTKRLENCRAPYPPTYSGKKYNCVPAGTPGGQSRSAAAGSAIPLILGAAAIAALVLTR